MTLGQIKAMLDALVRARYSGVFTIQAGDKWLTYTSDAELRRRVQARVVGWANDGGAAYYRYWALPASAEIADMAIDSPMPKDASPRRAEGLQATISLGSMWNPRQHQKTAPWPSW